MSCGQCGRANEAGSRFCAGCGAPLGRTCPACSHPNAADAKFCNGCGARLDDARRPSTSPGERRQITVLFCDLVGSTALSQRLDPEDLHDLLAGYQSICGDAVNAHDGHIAQFLGDGVMVYFGWPKAHEDDAQRAVMCGLGILEGMRSLNEKRKGDERLEVRIGMHTGRVVLTQVGSGGRQELLALGDTPNIAARVQSEAEPGQLLVGDTTWKLVSGAVEGESLGERALKGIDKPIELRRVSAAKGGVTRWEAQARGDLTPFVGRRAEIERLSEAWSDAMGGSPGFCLVRGDAGLGKSRLVNVFKDIATTSGRVLEAQCSTYHQDTAFRPIVEIFHRRFQADGAETPDERLDALDRVLEECELTDEDAAPLIASVLGLPTGDRYPPLTLNPLRVRPRTMEVLAAALAGLAVGRPVVLLVEDLHWADASTIELLGTLPAATEGSRVMCLYTARPEFDAEQVPGSVIELERLPTEQTRRILRRVAKNKALPPAAIDSIVKRSEGIPLFVEELTRALLESGALVEKESTWEARGDIAAGIPASVEASLMARIDNLEDARPTAQLGATIGRTFRVDLLKAVSDRGDAELAADLERLVDAGLAGADGEGADTSYTFRHALIQDAAYESLLRSTRADYHARIAVALQEGFEAVVAAQPELVAHHLTEAGRDAEAIDMWGAAGQKAAARGAVKEAHAHLSRAVECVGRAPTDDAILEKELGLQVALAPTLMAVHGWASPTVAAACERARELCFSLKKMDQLYPALWGLWTNQFVGGLLDAALETANQTLEMAVASGIPMVEITGRHAVAYSHYYRGEYEAALPHVDAAWALYDTAQEHALSNQFLLSSTVNLIAAKGSGQWMMGQQDQGLKELDRMVALARDVDHPAALSNALGVAVYMLTFNDDFESMRACGDELKSFARVEGFDLWYRVGVIASGRARLESGDTEGGLEELLEGVELFRQTGSLLMWPTVAVHHVAALRAMARPDEALEVLDDAIATAVKGHIGVLTPECRRLRGELLEERGDAEGAEAAYREAMTSAAEQKALSLELRAALSLHGLLAKADRGDEGLELVRPLYARFTESFDQPDLVRARALVDG